MDIHFVAGRIDGFERALGVQGHGDVEIFERCGGKFFGAQWQGVADEAVVGFEQLCVGDFDALGAVGFDGIDAHFEDVLRGVFEQGGVAHLAHDVLVDATRFVGIQQFGFDGVAVDLHGEFVKLRALGHGKQERAFEARCRWDCKIPARPWWWRPGR